MKNLTKKDLSTYNVPLQNRKAIIVLIRKELKEKNITDYWSLHVTGTNKFASMKFKTIPTGARMATFLIGKNYRRVPNFLDVVAEILGWMPTQKQKIKKYKEELKRHAITDYWTLIGKGPRKFFKLKFSITKKGGAIEFLSIVLGRSISRGKLSHLEELGKFLGWFPSRKQFKEKAIEELNKHGITNYWELRYKFSIRSLKKDLDFGIFGKGIAFIRFFIPNKIPKRKLCPKTVDIFAVWLCWMPTPEEKIERYKYEMRENGLVTYFDLMRIPYHIFESLDFRLLGKGRNFIKIVLEKPYRATIANNKVRFQTKILSDLAKKIGLSYQ